MATQDQPNTGQAGARDDALRVGTGAPLNYYVGDEWAPTEEQIAASRARYEKHEVDARLQWRALTDPQEILAARCAVVSASGFKSPDVPDIEESLRTLRYFALEDCAQFFARGFDISDERYLIEFQHPKLVQDGEPVGFRFIALAKKGWKSGDYFGLYLDGSIAPIYQVFSGDLSRTVGDPALAESYLAFVIDHIPMTKQGQPYVVRDLADFVLASKEGVSAPLKRLSSQFLVVPPASEEGDNHSIEAAVGIPRSSIILPTFLKASPGSATQKAYADIFTTMIYNSRCEYVVWRLFSDGSVDAAKVSDDTLRSAELPITPLRATQYQQAAIKMATDKFSKDGET